MKVRCVILGGGGHAHMIIDCLLTAGSVRICGILDRDKSRWGQSIFGIPILGSDEILGTAAARKMDHFVVGLGGPGDNRPRQKLFEAALACGLKPLTVIHPSVICSERAKVGSGSQLLPASVVNAGAELGANVIINTGGIVEHDCVIGDHVHVATGARLCGSVRIAAGAHVGAGATVRQGICIGEEAVVGAGAVVVKDVPPRTLVVGVPAKPAVWAGSR